MPAVRLYGKLILYPLDGQGAKWTLWRGDLDRQFCVYEEDRKLLAFKINGLPRSTTVLQI